MNFLLFNDKGIKIVLNGKCIIDKFIIVLAKKSFFQNFNNESAAKNIFAPKSYKNLKFCKVATT